MRTGGVGIVLAVSCGSWLAAAALPCASAAGPAAIARERLVAANYRQGMLAFQQRCSACHSLAEGGNDLVGPNLYGLFSRDAGGKRGFDFSDAMESAGFRWTPQRLLALIADPAFLPGTTTLPSGEKLAGGIVAGHPQAVQR